jgi:hypothetical protein
MNIPLYNKILDAQLSVFAPPARADVKPILVELELDLLKGFFHLLASRTLKVSADDGTIAFLNEILKNSLKATWLSFAYTDPDDASVTEKFWSGIKAMRALSESKNNDYSPYNIFKCGSIGLFCRMGDKMSRTTGALLAGTTLQVKEEKIADTAMDLVNYAVYQIMVAVDAWVTAEERAFFQKYLTDNGAEGLSQFYEDVGSQALHVTTGDKPAIAVVQSPLVPGGAQCS